MLILPFFKKIVKRIKDIFLYIKNPGSLIISNNKKASKSISKTYKNWGFVIQGPINQIDFSKIKNLMILYPKAEVVISTWKPKSFKEKEIIKNIQNFVSKLILSDFPSYTGIMNSNLQVIHLRAAIKYLKAKKNIKYLIKFRLDSIPNYPENMLSYFLTLNKLYPNRIWGADINTIANIPFSLSDIMMWSSRENFIKYWNSYELIYKNISPKEYILKSKNFSDLKFIEENKPAESNYCWNYILKHVNSNLRYTKESWFKYLKTDFGVFSSLHIGLFFNKYSDQHQCYSNNSNRYISFEKWLTNL